MRSMPSSPIWPRKRSRRSRQGRHVAQPIRPALHATSLATTYYISSPLAVLTLLRSGVPQAALGTQHKPFASSRGLGWQAWASPFAILGSVKRIGVESSERTSRASLAPKGLRSIAYNFLYRVNLQP